MTPSNDSGPPPSTRSWALVMLRFAAFTFATSLIANARAARAGVNVWTTHGPYGGVVTALAIDPTTPGTLYAGTFGGGVFQSTNSGGSWSAVNFPGLPNTDLSNLYVRTLAISPAKPSTLYAGTRLTSSGSGPHGDADEVSNGGLGAGNVPLRPSSG